MNQTVERFEDYRPLLFTIAYRMLGSVAEAEDIVQDAFLRYQAVPLETIDRPKAFLSTIVTRLALDRLKSAQARRELYPGPWLPEPIVTGPADDRLDPEALVSQRESISLAFLVLLESLTPLERAVFLLREVFEYPYPEIAEIVGRSEAACRQLFHRARETVADRRPRFEGSPSSQRRLVDSFFRACSAGDLPSLLDVLAEDITLWTDGGGKVNAARQPIYGSDRVARFLLNVYKKLPSDCTFAEAEVNAAPAIIVRFGADVICVVVLETTGGHVTGIRVIVNPEKLTHLRDSISAGEPGNERASPYKA